MTTEETFKNEPMRVEAETDEREEKEDDGIIDSMDTDVHSLTVGDEGSNENADTALNINLSQRDDDVQEDVSQTKAAGDVKMEEEEEEEEEEELSMEMEDASVDSTTCEKEALKSPSAAASMVTSVELKTEDFPSNNCRENFQSLPAGIASVSCSKNVVRTETGETDGDDDEEEEEDFFFHLSKGSAIEKPCARTETGFPKVTSKINIKLKSVSQQAAVVNKSIPAKRQSRDLRYFSPEYEEDYLDFVSLVGNGVEIEPTLKSERGNKLEMWDTFERREHERLNLYLRDKEEKLRYRISTQIHRLHVEMTSKQRFQREKLMEANRQDEGHMHHHLKMKLKLLHENHRTKKSELLRRYQTHPRQATLIMQLDKELRAKEVFIRKENSLMKEKFEKQLSILTAHHEKRQRETEILTTEIRNKFQQYNKQNKSFLTLFQDKLLTSRRACFLGGGTNDSNPTRTSKRKRDSQSSEKGTSDSLRRFKQRKAVLSSCPSVPLEVEIHNEGIVLHFRALEENNDKQSESKSDSKASETENSMKQRVDISEFVPWCTRARNIVYSLVLGRIPASLEKSFDHRNYFSTGEAIVTALFGKQIENKPSASAEGCLVKGMITDCRVTDLMARAQRVSAMSQIVAKKAVVLLEKSHSKFLQDQEYISNKLKKVKDRKDSLTKELVKVKNNIDMVLQSRQDIGHKLASKLMPSDITRGRNLLAKYEVELKQLQKRGQELEMDIHSSQREWVELTGNLNSTTTSIKNIGIELQTSREKLENGEYASLAQNGNVSLSDVRSNVLKVLSDTFAERRKNRTKQKYRLSLILRPSRKLILDEVSQVVRYRKRIEDISSPSISKENIDSSRIEARILQSFHPEAQSQGIPFRSDEQNSSNWTEPGAFVDLSVDPNRCNKNKILPVNPSFSVLRQSWSYAASASGRQMSSVLKPADVDILRTMKDDQKHHEVNGYDPLSIPEEQLLVGSTKKCTKQSMKVTSNKRRKGVQKKVSREKDVNKKTDSASSDSQNFVQRSLSELSKSSGTLNRVQQRRTSENFAMVPSQLPIPLASSQTSNTLQPAHLHNLSDNMSSHFSETNTKPVRRKSGPHMNLKGPNNQQIQHTPHSSATVSHSTQQGQTRPGQQRLHSHFNQQQSGMQIAPSRMMTGPQSNNIVASKQSQPQSNQFASQISSGIQGYPQNQPIPFRRMSGTPSSQQFSAPRRLSNSNQTAIQMSMGMQRQGSVPLSQQMSIHRQGTKPNQMPLQRQGSAPGPIPLQRQGSIPNQTSMQRQGSVPNQMPMQRQGSVPNQMPMQRQGSIPNQTPMQRQGSIPNQTSMQRQGSIPNQMPMQRQGSTPSQMSVQRQGPLPGPMPMQRQGSIPSQKNMQRQGSIPMPMSLQRQGSIPNQLSMQRQGSSHLSNQINRQQQSSTISAHPRRQSANMQRQGSRTNRVPNDNKVMQLKGRSHQSMDRQWQMSQRANISKTGNANVMANNSHVFPSQQQAASQASNHLQHQPNRIQQQHRQQILLHQNQKQFQSMRHQHNPNMPNQMAPIQFPSSNRNSFQNEITHGIPGNISQRPMTGNFAPDLNIGDSLSQHTPRENSHSSGIGNNDPVEAFDDSLMKIFESEI